MKQTVNTDLFWTEEVKANKGNPQKQLTICISNLPLPAAFKKGMVAVRTIIKEKIKAGKNTTNDVQLLYRLATVHSFCIPYASRLKEPGWNVIEAVPGAILWNAGLDYKQIGFTKLPLINKTDTKWLVEVFGNPTKHSTLNVVLREIWDKYELMLMRERDRKWPEFAELH